MVFGQCGAKNEYRAILSGAQMVFAPKKEPFAPKQGDQCKAFVVRLPFPERLAIAVGQATAADVFEPLNLARQQQKSHAKWRDPKFVASCSAAGVSPADGA
jgi:hypothetical protein